MEQYPKPPSIPVNEGAKWPKNLEDNETLAADVSIEDTAGNFVSTDVEGALSELFTSVSNGKLLVTAAITGKGGVIAGSDHHTFQELTDGVNSIPGAVGDALVSDVLAGKTFSTAVDSGLEGTMVNQGQKILTPGTANVIIPAGFHNGTGYIPGDPQFIEANLKQGVELWGKTGTLVPKLYATGSQLTIFYMSLVYALEVTGLAFKPKIILLNYTFNGFREKILITNNADYNTLNYTTSNGSYESATSGVNSQGWTLLADGFRCNLSDTSSPLTVTWYAWN